MDRVEFIGQTHQGNPITVYDIIRFFDHTMAAFEVVGEVEDVSVHQIADNTNTSLKIHVEHPNENVLDDIISNINDNLHNRKDVYGRSFRIDALKDGPYVNLSVREI